MRKTLSDTVAGAQMEESELVKEGGAEEYRFEAKVGDRIHYLRIKPSGELVKHTLRVKAELEVPMP